MSELMHIVLIDDSPVDRLAFLRKMQASETPWLRDTDIKCFAHPFENIEDYRKYDAVILDQEMHGMRGTDVAQAIHKMDWRIPVVLVTGSAPNDLPPDVRDYTWALAFKHGASLHHTDGEFGVLRSVLRMVAAIRDAYERGVKASLTPPSPPENRAPDTPA